MKIRCPICGKEVEYSKENPFRPFCSQSCRLIDLGAWADGDYCIEGEPGSAMRLSPEELESARLASEKLAMKKSLK